MKFLMRFAAVKFPSPAGQSLSRSICRRIWKEGNLNDEVKCDGLSSEDKLSIGAYRDLAESLTTSGDGLASNPFIRTL